MPKHGGFPKLVYGSRHEHYCEQCKKQFFTKQNKQRFCSLTCVGLAAKKRTEEA